MKRNQNEIELTSKLMGALKSHSCLLKAFWNALAPASVRASLPERVAPEYRFDGDELCKPDLTFLKGGDPKLYIEAKWKARTEPLQLIRGRSWMRACGAKDDQVLLLAHHPVELPEEVGWNTDPVPVKTILWRDVLSVLKRCVSMEGCSEAEASVADLEDFILNLNIEDSTETRLGIRSKCNHAYGGIFQRFIESRSGIRSDFLFGSSLSPRLAYGLKVWSECFNGTDVERILIFYDLETGGWKKALGPEVMCHPDKGPREKYRPELVLWHRSDIANSDTAMRRDWPIWREAIKEEKDAVLEVGPRKGGSGRRWISPPQYMPDDIVGLVRLRNSVVLQSEIQKLSKSGLVQRIMEMVLPLERIVQKVALEKGRHSSR